MTILHINSAITGDNSASRALSAAIVANLLAREPGHTVVTRDLAADPLPHLTLPEFAAAHSQAALADFKGADIVVIGAPMYNFTVPSQLKAWVDRIAVAGETFRYTEAGAEGLMGGKRVILALSRGGYYGADSGQQAAAHAESWLRAVMGFMGIEEVEAVVAEGLAMGPKVREAALHAALGRLATLAA